MRPLSVFPFAVCLLLITGAEIDGQSKPTPEEKSTASASASASTVVTSLMDWILWGGAPDADASAGEGPDAPPEGSDGEAEIDADFSSEDAQNMPSEAVKSTKSANSKLIFILPSIFAALVVLSILGLYVNKRRHALKLMNSVPVDPEVITVTSVVAPYGKI